MNKHRKEVQDTVSISGTCSSESSNVIVQILNPKYQKPVWNYQVGPNVSVSRSGGFRPDLETPHIPGNLCRPRSQTRFLLRMSGGWIGDKSAQNFCHVVRGTGVGFPSWIYTLWIKTPFEPLTQNSLKWFSLKTVLLSTPDFWLSIAPSCLVFRVSAILRLNPAFMPRSHNQLFQIKGHVLGRNFLSSSPSLTWDFCGFLRESLWQNSVWLSGSVKRSCRGIWQREEDPRLVLVPTPRQLCPPPARLRGTAVENTCTAASRASFWAYHSA